jgi:hypothetical protein
VDHRIISFFLNPCIEFLQAQNEAIPDYMGDWPTMPPLGQTSAAGGKSYEVDPVANIFKRMAAVAVATVPPRPTTPPTPFASQSSSDDEEETGDGSEWESEASMEEGMDMPLEVDADLGNATFATS